MEDFNGSIFTLLKRKIWVKNCYKAARGENGDLLLL
jgi:hypothetical protein